MRAIRLEQNSLVSSRKDRVQKILTSYGKWRKKAIREKAIREKEKRGQSLNRANDVLTAI